MNAVTIRLGDDSTMIEADGERSVIPVGAVSLTGSELVSDPPRAEELTNAIGLIADHLDDVVREVPIVAEADVVTMVGHLATVIAAVEFGGAPPLPFVLRRAAVEEVFRTVATEAAAERATNPGLPAGDVHTIVAGCCIMVAIMRHLHLDEVHVDIQDTADGHIGARP